MSKSAISRNFPDQNITHSSDLKLEPSLNLSEGKSKVLAQINRSYESGIKYYQAGSLGLAEQAFAAAVRPVLSKSDRKSLYVDVEDCKEEVLDALHYLGKIYLASNQYFNNYAKAAGIFQYCAGFAAKYKIDNPDKYLEEAYLVQEKFLKYLGKKINIDTDRDSEGDVRLKLEDYSQEIKGYKDSLAYIREEAAKQIGAIRDWPIEEIATRAKVVEEIYNECTNFFVNNSESKEQNPGLIQKMIGSCIKQLGPVPEGCEYSFIGFGSLAGGRMTPWSDLEFAILINEDKEEYKEYFRNLTKLLNIKVVNLGETPLRSLGVEALNNFRTADPKDEWFYDDVLKSGFSFDGPDWHACKLPLGRQGGYKVKKKIKLENGSEQGITINKSDFELILAPKQLAEFQLETKDTINTELAFNDQALIPEQKLQQESWYKSDTHLVQSMRLVSLIEGSQQLIDNYREQLHNNIIEKSEIIKDRAIKKLQEDLESFSLKLGEEEEGKLIDVKKDIFRIGDRIIDALANYYGVLSEEGQPSLNAWKAVDKMQEKGILSPKGAEHLKEALSIATELRLATYCYNQGQNETMSTYQPTVEHLTEAQKKKLLEETFYIKDLTVLHHFYYVMLRVQELVHKFCNPEHYNIVEAKVMLKSDQLFDDSNYNKGMVHARLLQYDKALEYMEKAEKEQPDNINLLNDLLSLYRVTSSIEKAINTAHKILTVSKDIHSDNPYHPDIAASYNKLSHVYRSKGEYDTAIGYCNNALQIGLNIYQDSPNNPAIATIYNDLGALYNDKGEYDKAIEKYDQSLKMRREVYTNHPDQLPFAESYNNIGNIYRTKGEYDKAIEYHHKALDIRLKAYEESPNHHAIAVSYNSLGDIYRSMRKNEKAMKHYELALQIRLKAYNHHLDHPSIADSYNNLGTIYYAKREYDKAVEYHHKALDIRLKVYEYSPNHPDLLSSYNNLGNAYFKTGEYSKAVEFHHKALDIAHKVHEQSPNHPDIIKYSNNLEKAKNLYMKTLNEEIKILPSEAESTSQGETYSEVLGSDEAEITVLGE